MIVAGTGHRPDKLGGYSEAAYQRLVGVAEHALLSLSKGLVLGVPESGIEAVISGGALGWDQALMEAAIGLEFPVDAYLPFVGFDGKWCTKARRKLDDLLWGCRSVCYVCEPGYLPGKMEARNRAMVDACDVVLACHDGGFGGTYLSGTYQTIRYARRKQRAVVNCYQPHLSLPF